MSRHPPGRKRHAGTMTNQLPTPPRRPRRRWLTALAWSLAALALAISTLWLFAGQSYWLDLLANLGAQLLLLLVLLLLVVVAMRRWRAVLLALLACAIQATPLLLHRAALFSRPPGPGAPPGAVRFMHYNDSSLSDKRDVYSLMERSGADVLSILSPPVHMQFDVFDGHGLEETYPGKLIRRWRQAPNRIDTEISPGFIVSRWPLTPFDCAFVGPMADRFIAGIVERPGGRFAVVAVHPKSPRTPERWHEGNSVVFALVTLSLKLQQEGFPVVVLADLNSTPTGWRSREACSGGRLNRAKPLLALVGTYPDVVPVDLRTRRTTGITAVWPASIAIDDALVSSEIEVVGWGAGARLLSEHRPVIVDLTIPAPLARAQANAP